MAVVGSIQYLTINFDYILIDISLIFYTQINQNQFAGIFSYQIFVISY